ncbi:hypothetical protein MTO96_012789 [Rhipicephalus appendiculatus]
MTSGFSFRRTFRFQNFGPSALRRASADGGPLRSSSSAAMMLDMTVAANTSSDVSKASDSGLLSVVSRTGLFGDVLAVDVLLTIKALRRGRTASVACTMSVASGPQAALKTSLAGSVGHLRLAGHGEMGRERDSERCKRRLRTCPFWYRLLRAET